MNIAAQSIGSSITLADLNADPYPILARLRRDEPVSWVPETGRYLVTRYKDTLEIERQPEIFISEKDSLVERAIGRMMLRLDGAEHRRFRSALEPTLKLGTIRARWADAYKEIVSEFLDRLAPRGRADLVVDLAGPCAAACLARLLGLRGATYEDLIRWSRAIMDASSNYTDDPERWARVERASLEIEQLLSELIPVLQRRPDDSIVSAMVQSSEGFTADEIRAHVMLVIGGGINEPRETIATAAFALLSQPDQLALVRDDPSKLTRVFDEALRWVSPVGMYPRQITQRVELSGTVLEAGTRICSCISSANRDETVFVNPDVFDITRPKVQHMAFGGGAHHCLGAWNTRVLVADALLPALFSRLPKLSLVKDTPVEWAGWVFRGPVNLPVEWQI